MILFEAFLWGFGFILGGTVGFLCLLFGGMWALDWYERHYRVPGDD